jgi:hypothetical protein
MSDPISTENVREEHQESGPGPRITPLTSLLLAIPTLGTLVVGCTQTPETKTAQSGGRSRMLRRK